MKKKIFSSFFIALGLIYIKSALTPLICIDEPKDYELFFGWKTTKNIFILVKLVIGVPLVIFNVKELLKHKNTKKNIIYLVLSLFLFGLLGYYDRIKELLF
ncbi:hypothetical protein FORMB_08060 [Formosa sp. Hel1_33_131]|uniref:hypothetical protein n=1 Tax=Formosa sp. Hel1_33_131 TaxID=1336794 RepID=UPI00084E1949|nr:hypothetical protein [Formosa sp. Hel1_33_131]AOR27858.1 hypothetical protein FORMB_08060 [Formosa sp. Hel1_33_131]